VSAEGGSVTIRTTPRPTISPADARELMIRADERCPYSNATRGNLAVLLSVDGKLAR
jgi:organic hydroperoxide reductase OsmC/OhrA